MALLWPFFCLALLCFMTFEIEKFRKWTRAKQQIVPCHQKLKQNLKYSRKWGPKNKQNLTRNIKIEQNNVRLRLGGVHLVHESRPANIHEVPLVTLLSDHRLPSAVPSQSHSHLCGISLSWSTLNSRPQMLLTTPPFTPMTKITDSTVLYHCSFRKWGMEILPYLLTWLSESCPPVVANLQYPKQIYLIRTFPYSTPTFLCSTLESTPLCLFFFS